MGELKSISKLEFKKTAVPSGKFKCVIFDLYGTLIDFNTRPLLREFSKILGVKASPVKLKATLIECFESDDKALEGFIEALIGRQSTSEEYSKCRIALESHLSTAKLTKGARLLLSNLKARNIKIALLSNVAQVFKKPFFELGLAKYFDVINFSSDIGTKKPMTSAYIGVTSELGLLPSDCLFIGDDVKSDYDAPKSLGMNAINIGNGRRDVYVNCLSELVWLTTSCTPLLKIGAEYTIDDQNFMVTDIELLSEEELGRYNIVARVHGLGTDNVKKQWYVKRYIDPASAYIEETAHRIMCTIGAAAPRAYLLEGEEPLLFSSPAKGAIWKDGDYDIEVAEQVGIQAAAAYILSNADWRPRNTYIQKSTSKVTSIDLEHCLFDRVLGINLEVFDGTTKESIDNLGLSTWAHTRTRVLSYSAIRRAIKCFTQTDNRNTSEFKQFLKGWDKTFKQAISNRRLIRDILQTKMNSQQLVIGTKSHRRAFANVDLHDFLERIELGHRVMRLKETWDN
ncbi:HAD family hydrolase [Vibrio sp. Evd11]|uniref:HAD family hydrolase n=1 Tax=Vibrio sp. Evd11 TaxID=1207404 RepID=UPI000EFB335C|nr:HAD family hydrolase [Vibrio sp. Evd11]